MADKAEKLESRTIRHNLFTYELPDGGQAIAWRGDTVDLLPDDITRGEKFGAFTDEAGELPEPSGSELPKYPIEGSPAEQDAWVASGSVQEIVTAVSENPDTLQSVLAAEQRKGDGARTTLLAALTKLAEGS